jgi:hypothetical protein
MTITNTQLWEIWEKAKSFFSWVKIKELPSWIKECFLCPLTCFLNLFFVTSLTLGLIYVYYIKYDESNEVKLCRSNEIITHEQGSEIQCCNGKSHAFWLCKVVEKTTQATIILMLVILAFLSLEVYCDKCDKPPPPNNVEEDTTASQKGYQSKEHQSSVELNKERRNNVITVLIATLGISAIPTGISLIICAFYDMRWMQLLSGVEVYIAFAGISIIAIAFLSVSDEEKGNLGTSGSSNAVRSMQQNSKQ